jgi:hypothetical protein
MPALDYNKKAWPPTSLYTALVRAGQGLKKKSNESWAAGQRCVNVTARYEPEALWHEARCSIVNVVLFVNDNENEKITKTKKKKTFARPRARWAKTFVVLLGCLFTTSRRVNKPRHSRTRGNPLMRETIDQTAFPIFGHFAQWNGRRSSSQVPVKELTPQTHFIDGNLRMPAEYSQIFGDMDNAVASFLFDAPIDPARQPKIERC